LYVSLMIIRTEIFDYTINKKDALMNHHPAFKKPIPMTENIPTPILESIRATIGSAICYIKYSRAESPVHNKLRVASQTLGDLITLQKKNEEQPFWYSTYEGLVERYVQLRTEHKKLKEQNKELKENYEDLKERYWNAMSLIEEQIEEPERL
jgi:hypothetical protein